jgi:hypothetical protein
MKPVMRIRLGAGLGLGQMSLWRQLIAIVLLIAFVPATFAAALPLVYCFGADGHRAIELLDAGTHHATEHAERLSSTDPGPGVEAPKGCVDIDIVSLASLPQPSSLIKSLPSKSPVPHWATIAAIQDGHWSLSAVDRRERAKPDVDHLASHRTIVLLI